MTKTKTTPKQKMREVIDEWQTFSDLTTNKDINSEDRRMLFNVYLRRKGNRKRVVGV